MSTPSMNNVEEQQARRSEAIVQVIEASVEVRRRFQFFIWTQGKFQTLLPHKLAICGVYDRGRKHVRLETFNSIVVNNDALAQLSDGKTPLMQYIVNAWIAHRGKPLVVRLGDPANRAIQADSESLMAAGFTEMLVHGVSRPQRSSEIETLFVFANSGEPIEEARLTSLELLLPHLHSTYLRVQAFERECSDTRTRPEATPSGYSAASISEREEQVLSWVREGMSNQQIGAQLGISPLTVKNHVQKILRKLGATNRAQAVARAMSMNLLLRPGKGEPLQK